MGGSSSKPVEAPTSTASSFTPDLSKFTVTGDYAVELQRKAEEAAAATAKAMEEGQAALASQAAAASRSRLLMNIGWGFLTIVLLSGIGFAIWYILSKTLSNVPDPTKKSTWLTIHNAMHGTQDVTTRVTQMINTDGTLTITPSISATLQSATGATLAASDSFKITYQYASDPTAYTKTFQDTDTVLITPTTKPSDPPSGDKSAPPPPPTTQATQPGFFARLWGSVTGGSSGDLLGSIHDATTTTSVSGSNAPLSSEGDGAYGMQWWMFVKDWNYGYGKDKSVVVRPDPTNSKVMNPSISLHPTDNSLRVSVSVFPSTEGGAAASQPAPAGHSGASDDVFVCEVPNIPLQTWFSVSVTVFGRNMDIYIDGKLVKSCFLTGVPKPATGDIQVTPGGGFSGNICSFTHYPRMLTPSDANSFWTAGTSCQKATAPSSTAAATGYSVKFGVYDPLGKQVQQYTF